MIRAALFAAMVFPHQSLAQNLDLTPLQNIDTSVFLPGDCGPVRVLADFMLVIECEGNNPVISFIAGMAPQYAEDFALSADIDAQCAKTAGCISAETLSIGCWSGGRDFHEGEFGNVSHTVLVSGSADLEITSRALDDDTAQHNADIAYQLLRDLVLCPDMDTPAADCPTE